MRIIVAGSRMFDDYELLKSTLDRLTSKLDKEKLTILSGHAEGADKLGELWCREHLVKYEVYHAEWRKYGKSAGPRRNAEMIEAVGEKGALVAFHVNDSKGTADIINRAKKAGLRIRIIKVKM